MKVLVIGAGAVGSYYGGRLQQAGHDVTLVGRPAHVAAIRARGLTIDSKITGRHTVRPYAQEALENRISADLVLFCVKSYDTEQAAQTLSRVLHSPLKVLCLQNGIDNHEVAGKILEIHNVVPAVIYAGVRIPEPGVVEHVSRGEIVLPQAEAALAGIFQNAGIGAGVSDNILGMLWSKLLLNASCNALGMISGASFGALAANASAREVIAGAVEEVARVAAAKGVRLPAPNPVEQVLKTAGSLGLGVSSMLQDFRAGKRIEIDALNGVIVRFGKSLDIPTPYNSTLHAAARLMEELSAK